MHKNAETRNNRITGILARLHSEVRRLIEVGSWYLTRLNAKAETVKKISIPVENQRSSMSGKDA